MNPHLLDDRGTTRLDGRGLITQTREFEDSPYHVWKVEDAHFGLDVRQGAVDLLEHLCTNLGVRLICLEGASGAFSTIDLRRVLRRTELPRLRRDLAERRLSAPEYFALTADVPVILRGVEDPSAYRENLQALGAARRVLESAQLQLRLLLGSLDELKSSHYNREQLLFDRGQTASQESRFQLEFVWMLRECDPLTLEAFPRIQQLLRIMEVERKLDQSKTTEDLARLWSLTCHLLDHPESDGDYVLTRVVRAALKARGAEPDTIRTLTRDERLRQYADFVISLRDRLPTVEGARAGRMEPGALRGLLEVARLCGIPVDRFPHAVTYVHHVHQALRLPKSSTLADIQDAAEIVEKNLFRSDSVARSVAIASRAILGAIKLCGLVITPADKVRLVKEFGQLSAPDLLDLIKQTGSVHSGFDLEIVGRALSAAHSFYKLAPLRGSIIGENTLREMREHRASEAVLVTGGFLTEFIWPVFESMSVSFDVVLPKSSVDESTFLDYGRQFDPDVKPGSFLAELQERNRGRWRRWYWRWAARRSQEGRRRGAADL